MVDYSKKRTVSIPRKGKLIEVEISPLADQKAPWELLSYRRGRRIIHYLGVELTTGIDPHRWARIAGRAGLLAVRQFNTLHDLLDEDFFGALESRNGHAR